MTLPTDDADLPLELLERLDAVCGRFEAAWRGGQEPRLEDYLTGTAEPERRRLFRELYLADAELRRARGLPGAEADYRRRFPEYADLLPVPPADPRPPPRIARYRIEKVLGEGGFGRVYLAHDDQLQRPVAVKVPHPGLVARPGDAGLYLAEARAVATLDHPNIVPVYDVGSTAEYPVYVVTRYIPGTDLGRRLKERRPSPAEAAELVAAVAEALHCAHKHGLVHRDVKPENILIGADGTPYLVDFGLALREQHVGTGPRWAGTPAYMSPEQARGEGHRVDGRSDVFSLGAVFYELLTGRRPFHGASAAALMEQITQFEPRPPRQTDDRIPRELERICLKALARRLSERYTTAKDLADDLRQSLADRTAGQNAPRPDAAVTPVWSAAGGPTSVGVGPRVVPKGLRAFDAHDAEFFLELLPGPRDRHGLPDSIRFWKSRIEPPDGDETFTVGLVYGPSGCGKSSLIRAGLLPRLAGHVVAVYVEAAAGETEARLLHTLRKRCPGLPPGLGLKDSLASLRRGEGLPAGGKLLIVLDQFEQWLHAPRELAGAELVEALRQCDGGRVQCLVLVRDDFWLAVSRFMAALEVALVQGRNTALVDLFDARHARKVLAAFGRAYGALPEDGVPGKEQAAFLDQAVAGLADDGKVVPVRLALFADMVKGRPWVPATLSEVGGAQGVGIAFLEDAFGSRAGSPRHRVHEKAARQVLKALLPEAGTDIKGNRRSREELLQLSGYAGQTNPFDDLLDVLDGELRLLTPADPEGTAGAVSYQLTHDYLVPALREWLTRKQKETRRGRAELLLADLAAVWGARPEPRQLPSLPQWFRIRCLTPRRDWSAAERKMMRAAARYHAVRVGLLAVGLLGLATAALAIRGRVVERASADHAAALVRRIRDAETSQVPVIVAEMSDYRTWIDPLLRAEYGRARPDSRERLHAGLALLPVDGGQVEYLSTRLLDAAPHELPVIRNALAAHKDDLTDHLWGVTSQPARGQEAQRLRAACALARYAPDDPRWAAVGRLVAADLVAVPGVHLAAWMELLRPVRRHLLAPLADAFRAAGRESDRARAADILSDYAADRPGELADLLMDADELQFATLLPKLRGHGERGLPALLAELDKQPRPAWNASPLDPGWADLAAAAQQGRERLARRQANAAVALLHLGRPERLWSLLPHQPDPRVRSSLIHRLSPLGAPASLVVGRLRDEKDVTARRALLLCLGEFGEKELPRAERESLLPKLLAMYRDDPDPGLHGAAAWLLVRWGQKEQLRVIDRGLVASGEGRSSTGARRWYVTGQGQTFVVIDGPVEFLMGSPPGEDGRVGGPESRLEALHRRRIVRTFALAAHEVTVRQYQEFRKGHDHDRHASPTPDSPVNRVSWYDAAQYCNWLSEQERIPREQWCYEPNSRGEYALGMRARANYLELTGYRLPTEAEWEYACRAGAVTRRHYGDAEELLGNYAWYTKNSRERAMLAVGTLMKPNDLGLFEMLGNALEWTHDAEGDYPAPAAGQAAEDKGMEEEIRDPDNRVTRSGSYLIHPDNVRAAFRRMYQPTYRSYNLGFRPARTLPPIGRP